MTNIFGNDKVYVCSKCGSDNVGAEFSFYGYYNEPYQPPRTLANKESLVGSDWCYDCDEAVIVIEKE